MQKISIITITYNSENTLEETIHSVLKQEYPMLEYIIVDGGSTDNTLNIIKKYDSGIATFISEPDNGISDAFNKGICVATGEIIGIINSDDLLYGKSLNQISDYFEKHRDIDILCGNVLRFNDGEKKGRVAKPGNNWSKLLYQFPMYHPAVFIKKSAYDNYGLFDIAYRYAMDYELISRMYYKGARIESIDEILSCFRLGGVSETTSKATHREHKKVAIRNGCPAWKAQLYALRLNIKCSVSIFIKKIGLEKFIRSLNKKTEYLPVY